MVQTSSDIKVKLFKTYTDVYYWNRDCDAFCIINQGGTSSSKTISILQNLARECIKRNIIVTVVGQDIPNLYSGAIRDFKTLISDSPLLRAALENPTADRGPYRFHSGAVLEFKSYEGDQDAKNGKRDILFINEANGISYAIAEQLIMRTKEKVYIDFNPDVEFWTHTILMKEPSTVRFISNFTHNPYTPPKIKARILSWKSLAMQGNKHMKNRWRVYGLGLTGITEGVIFEDYTLIDTFPENCRVTGYGLDFGFTNNNTALIKTGIDLINMGDGVNQVNLYLQEKLYKNKLGQKELLKELNAIPGLKSKLIVADGQQEDYISFLQAKGYKIIPAVKGPGSVKFGIDCMLDTNMHITEDSKNLIKESELYKWMYDTSLGIWKDEPIKTNNDGFSAARYISTYYLGTFHKKAKKTPKNRKPRRHSIIRH